MRLPAGAEWIIILLIVLLLFGASRLPGLAKSVGRSMRIFRSEVRTPAADDAPAGSTSSEAPGPDAAGDAPRDHGPAGSGPAGASPTGSGQTGTDGDSGRSHT